MSIKFSTSGRPFVECPKCQKLHAIYRRGDYINKDIVKAVCRSCGTKWILDDDEKTTLRRHYEKRLQENAVKKREKEEKRREKEQKNQENLKNNEQHLANQKQIQSIKPPAKEKTPNKKSWLEELLS